MAHVNNGFKQMRTAANFIEKWCGGNTPPTLLILGTGLGHFPNQLRNARKISYAKIPHFPASTVPGHAGMLWYGDAGKKQILVMQGRVHYYEGLSMQEVIFPVRALIMAGVNTVIATNAAGGINPSYKSGNIVLIKDHINLMGADPLRGFYDVRLGPRFVDMSQVYDPALRDKARRIARKNRIRLHEGVYIAASGPSFETPALIRAFKTLGADHVAMSLVPEVTAARQMGVRVLGLSLITNLAAGRSAKPLMHEAHLRTAKIAEKKFIKLMEGIINEIV